MISNTKSVSYYLRSLAITAIVTFALPLVLIGATLLLLTVLTVLVPQVTFSQEAGDHLQNFLRILGSGSPWQGMLLMGIASCLVGMMFDTYAFYRYQGIHQR